jgi:hypothetical protein
MIIGSNSNPYKKLLKENDSDDAKILSKYSQEDLLKFLINFIAFRIHEEYRNYSEWENQPSTHIEENYQSISSSDTVEEYIDIIEYVKENISIFSNYSNEKIKNLLVLFMEEGKSERIDVSYEGKYKIGVVDTYLPDETPIYFSDTDNVALSDNNSVSLKQLILKMDIKYIEGIYSDYFNRLRRESYNSIIIKLKDYQSEVDHLFYNIIDNDEAVFEVDLNSMYSYDYTDTFDVYIVDIEDFIDMFTDYLRSNNLFGISHDDNSVWEDE